MSGHPGHVQLLRDVVPVDGRAAAEHDRVAVVDTVVAVRTGADRVTHGRGARADAQVGADRSGDRAGDRVLDVHALERARDAAHALAEVVAARAQRRALQHDARRARALAAGDELERVRGEARGARAADVRAAGVRAVVAAQTRARGRVRARAAAHAVDARIADRDAVVERLGQDDDPAAAGRARGLESAA